MVVHMILIQFPQPKIDPLVAAKPRGRYIGTEGLEVALPTQWF